MSICYIDLRPDCMMTPSQLWGRLTDYHLAEQLRVRHWPNPDRWATLWPDATPTRGRQPVEGLIGRVLAAGADADPRLVLIDLSGWSATEVIRAANLLFTPHTLESMQRTRDEGWLEGQWQLRCGLGLARRLEEWDETSDRLEGWDETSDRHPAVAGAGDPFATPAPAPTPPPTFPPRLAVVVIDHPNEGDPLTDPEHWRLWFETPERLTPYLLRELVDRSTRGESRRPNERLPGRLLNVPPIVGRGFRPRHPQSACYCPEVRDDYDEVVAEEERRGQGGLALGVALRLFTRVPPPGRSLPTPRGVVSDKDAPRVLGFLLRLARWLAAHRVEGNLVRCTLVVSEGGWYRELLRPPTHPPDGGWGYLPHMDLPPCRLEMTDDFRRHVELLRSEDVAMYADAATRHVAGVFSHTAGGDHTRASKCRRLAKWSGGVVFHVRDGKVEVYDDRRLVFWYDSFEWMVTPFEAVQHRLQQFFNNPELTGRVIGAFSCLQDECESSIVTFVDTARYGRTDPVTRVWDPPQEHLSPLRPGVRPLVNADAFEYYEVPAGGCPPIKRVSLDAVLGTLPVDGTHIVNTQGELVRLGYNILVKGNSGAGGTGREAAKALSREIGDRGFVIKVSGGGGLILYEQGVRM